MRDDTYGYDYQADDTWIPEGGGIFVGIVLGAAMWALVIIGSLLLGVFS
jgi:hypothetical protein